MAEALRSPTLAGIATDPHDNNKRVVPASTRPDGSIRKELRVKPGYVPPEEVAKYKVGQGSVRSQLATAQARGQAPPSPSPAASSSLATPLRPSPSDFVPRDKPQYPNTTASPSKPAAPSTSRLGSAASRWATAPPDPVPIPALAPAATRGKLTGARGNRGGRSKSSTRGKRPQVPASQSLEVPTSQEAEDDLSAAETELVVSEVPEVPSLPDPATQAPSEPVSTSSEKDPLSLSMEWPDTSAGDWWEEDEDLDIRRATKALEGVAISEPRQDEREKEPRADTSQASAKRAPLSPSKTGQKIKGAGNAVQNGNNGKGRQGFDAAVNAGKPANEKRKVSGNQQTGKVVPQPQAGTASVLLGRMEPRSAEQAKAQSAPIAEQSNVPQQPEQAQAGTPPADTSGDKILAAASSANTSNAVLSDQTIDQIKERSRAISNELRQLNQLRKYAASGAVLTVEQKTRLGQSSNLQQELVGIRLVTRELAEELEQLVSAGQS